LLTRFPIRSETTNKTRKIKKQILAIEAAPAANPPKPRIAAINAITKNIIVQRNIIKYFTMINIVYSTKQRAENIMPVPDNV
jgi:hypothetical protein